MDFIREKIEELVSTGKVSGSIEDRCEIFQKEDGNFRVYCSNLPDLTRRRIQVSLDELCYYIDKNDKDDFIGDVSLDNIGSVLSYLYEFE